MWLHVGHIFIHATTSEPGVKLPAVAQRSKGKVELVAVAGEILGSSRRPESERDAPPIEETQHLFMPYSFSRD
jgi:hypothetical protein